MDSLGGDLLECDPAAAIAAKHAVTTAQVLLRWALQRGAAVIPKTVSNARLAENAGALGVALDAADLAALDALDRGAEGRLCWKSDPLRGLEFD